jgi:hypothetical protein
VDFVRTHADRMTKNDSLKEKVGVLNFSSKTLVFYNGIGIYVSHPSLLMFTAL